MSPSKESIGERLRRLRVERGLSQRELSEPGVSYAYISRIEAGTRQPSVKALRKLARKLGVSAEYLETGLDVSQHELREMRLADAELQLRLDQDAEAALAKLRGVLEESEAAGDTPTATRARLALGSHALDRGRPAEAVSLLERAADDADLVPSVRPDVFANLGRAYALAGDPRAVELLESCLEDVIEREPENVSARIKYATFLSDALSDAGEFDRAQALLGDVLSEAGEYSDPRSQVHAYWSLARLASTREQYALGLDYARRALALVAALEDTVQLGRAHLGWAVVLVRQRKAVEAETQLALAERLLGPSPSPADLADLRTEQAKAALLLERGEEAAGLAREALELLGDTDPGGQGAAAQALGGALELRRELTGAIEAYARSAAAYERAGRLTDAVEAHRARGHALRAAGREGDALDALDAAARLAVRAAGRERPAPSGRRQ